MPRLNNATFHSVVDRWLARYQRSAYNKVLNARECIKLQDCAYTRGELLYAEHQHSVIKWLRNQLPAAWKSPFSRRRLAEAACASDDMLRWLRDIIGEDSECES